MTLAQWVVGVWFLVWNLLEHGFDEGINAGIVFDQILERDQDMVQRLAVSIDVVNDSAEPVSVGSLVVGEPFA